jgi:hypothetical protein
MGPCFTRVYAKDKRLSHAIFGPMEATMDSTSSASARAPRKLLVSDLPCLTTILSRKLGSITVASLLLFYSTDILMLVYLAFLQVLNPSRPLCPRKFRQASIQPVRVLASACNEKGENKGRRTYPTDFYSDTHMG